jgi:hypothetical protein
MKERDSKERAAVMTFLHGKIGIASKGWERTVVDIVDVVDRVDEAGSGLGFVRLRIAD